MVYNLPPKHYPIDQGDLLDGCPLLHIVDFDPSIPDSPQVSCSTSRVVVLSQACDLANEKMTRVTVAPVFDALWLVEQDVVKVSDVRGPIRQGRVFGWYFLPASEDLGFSESIVDLRQLHTVPLDVLRTLARYGFRRARIQPLYREHLAKHFADTYSRIGLPEPYQTEP